jgi:uracil-DNA glycosylase family protein
MVVGLYPARGGIQPCFRVLADGNCAHVAQRRTQGQRRRGDHYAGHDDRRTLESGSVGPPFHENVPGPHDVADGDASALIPPDADLDGLRDAARGCTACELFRVGTQTVFGEGPAEARIMLVGEQPGDREDIEGHPFVGPAGGLLDTALERAGIERNDVYVTNAVKHFRWEEQRGKRRIHKKPALAHVRACAPWLQAELEVVHPEVVVLLGATAAQAVLGTRFKVTEHRGEFVEADLDALVTATVHPSSILRSRDDRERGEALQGFVRDLAFAASGLRDGMRSPPGG